MSQRTVSDVLPAKTSFYQFGKCVWTVQVQVGAEGILCCCLLVPLCNKKVTAHRHLDEADTLVFSV